MDKTFTKLQEIIEDSGKKKNAIAEDIGVNSKQIRRWINGDQEMGIWKLKAICEELEVSADYLLEISPKYESKRKDFLKADPQKPKKETTTIEKDMAIDILLWAEEQGHITGDVELLIQTINEYEGT